MEAWITVQLEFVFRVLLAAACGGAIGYERERRLKMAGIRTHLIVCIAAALMMIVSKYGFGDILGQTGIGLDPSRIAANVVTAIGFLGAGVIFIRNQNVSGVTTAAGLWATVGVGMAIGAGMYFIGIVVTGIIVLLQVILHTRLVKEAVTEQIVIRMSPEEDPDILFQEIFLIHQIEVLGMSAKRLDDDQLEVRMSVKYPKNYELTDLIKLLREHPNIRSVEV